MDTADGLVDQIKLNVVLLSCVMLHNFGQMIMELLNEDERFFQTFIFLVETVLPSSLNSLDTSGKVPFMSVYETKILVCGLSRAFFGESNSVMIPHEEIVL